MFKVETGEGLPDASSYVEVAYADSYISFYYPNDVEWSAKSEAEKQLALVTATAFVDRLINWRGTRLTEGQALEWPRTQFYDADGFSVEAGTIPTKLKDAVVNMALQSLTSDLYDQGVYLSSQAYGSSSESYKKPVRDGGNIMATRILRDFARAGYGSNGASIVTIHRA